MNFYGHDDYRALLKELVAERKATDARVNFQQMSLAVRVPKSYLSKVMHGGAHLSVDQLYLVGKYLKLTDEEQRYLQLLLDFARTGLAERRAALEAELRRIQAAKRQTHEHLAAEPVRATEAGLSEYYLEPHNQIIHICLSIPRYAKDPARLAKDLGLAPAKVNAALATLERLGLIGRADGGGWKTLVRNIHLPPGTPVYKAWRTQLKLLALHRMEAVPDGETYSFSAVFSATPEVRRQAHARLLAALKEIEGLVRGATQEEAYQISIDLFPWT